MLLQFRNDTQMNWGDCIEGSLLDRVRERRGIEIPSNQAYVMI